MDLSNYDNENSDKGRPLFIVVLWYLINSILFSSFIPGTVWRVFLLKLFGAKVGKNILIKPFVRVKYPWKLSIGNNSWIGEKTWIDNIDTVVIGENCCISQGVYICSGNHNWSSESFEYLSSSIVIKDKVWVASMSQLSPGVILNEGVVLCIGSVAFNELDSWSIYKGNPAEKIKDRKV